MKLTIQTITDEAKGWPTDAPNKWYINGTFTDGSEFSYGAKSEAEAGTVIADLTALLGQESEFEVAKKGERNGHDQFWLNGYPGKPAPERKGGAPAAWRNTEAGSRFEQDCTNRRTALMQAVITDPERWPLVAEEMLEWLSGAHGASDRKQTQPPAPTPPVQGSAKRRVAAAEEQGSPSPTSAAPRCPSCGSGEIGKKGKTWKCFDCQTEWS